MNNPNTLSKNSFNGLNSFSDGKFSKNEHENLIQ